MEGKHKIEFVIAPNGVKFLNYWDWAHGRDVCCQIIDNKLFLFDHDENGEVIIDKEISYQTFFELVKKSIDEINLD